MIKFTPSPREYTISSTNFACKISWAYCAEEILFTPSSFTCAEIPIDLYCTFAGNSPLCFRCRDLMLKFASLKAVKNSGLGPRLRTRTQSHIPHRYLPLRKLNTLVVLKVKQR